MIAAGFDVERLNPIALSRLSVINLTGNDPAQSLQGNSLNNLLIGVVLQQGWHNLAEAQRYYAAHLADQGALVGPSGVGGPTKLATIVQTAPIYVTFTVNEQQVLQIRQQLRSEGKTIKDLGPIPVEIGLQTENNFPHKGTIDDLAPELDASTGTMTVRAVLDNKDAALTPGLFVKVRVPATRDLDAMLVPDSALGNSQSGRYLFVVGDKDIVEQRSVDVGDLVDGHMRLVKSGLKGDDRVVVGGLQRAIPGNAVKPVEQQATANAAPVPAPPVAGAKP